MKTPTWPPAPCTHNHTQTHVTEVVLYDLQYTTLLTNMHVDPLCFCHRVKEGTSKEMMGIVVSYRVKVKLVVSRGGWVTGQYYFES